MNARFTLIILIAILITIVSMQNTQPIHLKIIFWEAVYPAAYFLIFTALMGFIFGLLFLRRTKKISTNNHQQNDDYDVYPPDTLSKEDRDYIS